MRKGLVRITRQLIEQALRFPTDWKIESMIMRKNSLLEPYIEFIISGSDFPEVEGTKIKECSLIVHKDFISYEVKEVA